LFVPEDGSFVPARTSSKASRTGAVTRYATSRAKGRAVLSAVQRGAEAIALIKANALGGLSIGYKVLEDERDAKTGVRKLLKLQLFEVSLVAMPMNSNARIAGKELTAADFNRSVDRINAAARALACA
jgi:phage head maturation protease